MDVVGVSFSKQIQPAGFIKRNGERIFTVENISSQAA
jgi:hypothetical protein